MVAVAVGTPAVTVEVATTAAAGETVMGDGGAPHTTGDDVEFPLEAAAAASVVVASAVVGPIILFTGSRTAEAVDDDVVAVAERTAAIGGGGGGGGTPPPLAGARSLLFVDSSSCGTSSCAAGTLLWSTCSFLGSPSPFSSFLAVVADGSEGSGGTTKDDDASSIDCKGDCESRSDARRDKRRGGDATTATAAAAAAAVLVIEGLPP